MTSLQLALAEKLGAKKPTQMETIWRCVKEMQPVNYRDVTKRTNLPTSSVSSILCDMAKRGMVYTRGGPGKGPTGTVNEYMTDMQSYKLLPTPKPGYVQPAPVRKEPQPEADKQTTSPNVPRVIIRKVVNLDDLTIGEAKALYRQLKEMFGD